MTFLGVQEKLEQSSAEAVLKEDFFLIYCDI